MYIHVLKKMFTYIDHGGYVCMYVHMRCTYVQYVCTYVRTVCMYIRTSYKDEVHAFMQSKMTKFDRVCYLLHQKHWSLAPN